LDRLQGRSPRQPTNAQGKRLSRKLCPCNPTAPHDLPFSAGLQESLLVGLIGAKSSGKSHFIASLVQRFQGQVASDFSAAMIPCTDETPKRYQREFYGPLFDKKVALPVTIGQQAPLIYDLTFDGSLWGERKARSVTLALYDTAGEAFNDPAEVRRVVQYLRAAAGVVFLIDPLQIPEVRQKLPRSVPLPELSSNGEPSQIIANVLGVMEGGKVLETTESLSIPVAVALAKCDVLRDAGLIDLNRLWNADRRHIAAFDREMHEDINGMMGEWVHRWSLAAHSTLARRFSRVAFFGVSATGCAIDNRTNRYPFVSPWRVEDPFLWLLAELGVIPSKEPG
jgi:GTPase SAR1 family protein